MRGDTDNGVQALRLSDPIAPLVLADGQQSTVELPVAVADASSIRFVAEPWESRTTATFSSSGTREASAYPKEPGVGGAVIGGFGKPVNALDLRITATPPAPYAPSTAAGASTTDSAMAGALTLTNTGDSPVDLRWLLVHPAVGGAACPLISDPAVGTGAAPQVLAPRATVTVPYAFYAADPASADVQLALTVPESGNYYSGYSDDVAVLFTGKPGTEPPAPADRAAIDKADVPVAKGASSGVTFGAAVRWRDATRATIGVPTTKPLPKDYQPREGEVAADPQARDLTVKVTFVGPAAGAIRNDPGIVVVGGGNAVSCGVVDVDDDELSKGVTTATASCFVTGADNPVVVLAPPGRQPVWAGKRDPGELRVKVPPRPGSPPPVTFGKPVDLPGGLRIHLSAPKPDAAEPHPDGGSSAPAPTRSRGVLTVTNTAARAVWVGPDAIATGAGGEQLSGRVIHDAGDPAALVPGSTLLPAGATVTAEYLVPAGGRPELITPGAGWGWLRVRS